MLTEKDHARNKDLKGWGRNGSGMGARWARRLGSYVASRGGGDRRGGTRGGGCGVLVFPARRHARATRDCDVPAALRGLNQVSIGRE